MTAAALGVLAGVGCGRYGFDPRGTGSDDGGAPGSDATPGSDGDPGADGSASLGADAGPPPGCMVVTTDADESDVGESAMPPHQGAGLSLREAIALANDTAGADCIGFARSMTIRPETVLPSLTDRDTVINGSGAVVVVDGVRVTGGTVVGLDLAANGTSVTQLQITNWGPSLGGIGVRAFGGASVGPNVTISRCETGVRVLGSGVDVIGNRIRECTDVGVSNANGVSGLLVAQNVFHFNLVAGVQVDPGSLTAVRHNTFFQNGSAGIDASNGSTLSAVENNAFAQNGGFAIDANGASISALDFNAYFANAGECRGCVTGANAVFEDPRFASAPNDLSLLPGSPLIDAGRDTGLDVNGAGAGSFDGDAPDIGAVESE